MAKAKKSTSLQNNWQLIIIVMLALLLAGALTWALLERNRADMSRGQEASIGRDTLDAAAALDEHGITPLSRDKASNNQQTTKELEYLIEEEKLAHDMYQLLYDTWGARVFSNIASSETMHQNLVLEVMKSRGIADPRQTTAGRFTNSELQRLYDQLAAQGKQSLKEAYRVGVAIEERDIADLEKTLDELPSQDTDVKAVLENLLSGSQNHLRAFSRQAAR